MLASRSAHALDGGANSTSDVIDNKTISQVTDGLRVGSTITQKVNKDDKKFPKRKTPKIRGSSKGSDVSPSYQRLYESAEFNMGGDL